MKKEVGIFFKSKRKKIGISAMELGKRVGVSDAHILFIENSKRNPTFDLISRLLDALDSSWEEFLRNTGYIGGDQLEVATIGKLRKVPLLTFVNAAKFEECDVSSYCQSNECIETDIDGKHIFALTVACDSMEPEFVPGDVIIVDPKELAEVNDYVVVANNENEITLKQLKKYGNSWVLHPLNPRYEDNVFKKKDELRIIGVVKKKEKRFKK